MSTLSSTAESLIASLEMAETELQALHYQLENEFHARFANKEVPFAGPNFRVTSCNS